MKMPLRLELFLFTFTFTLVVSVSQAKAQTASLVEDLATQEVPAFFQSFYPLHPLGQSLFFESFDTTSGREPWATDGTVSGTRMLADTCPASCGSEGEILGTLGGRLLWLEGRIWSTDGTPAGTFPLTDPDLRIGDGSDADSVLAGGRIYFQGCRSEDFETECTLWSTDGTQEGTAPVPVRTPDAIPRGASSLTAGEDRVYYLASGSSSSSGPELWKAEADGTRRIGELPDRVFEVWTTWGNLIFFTVRAEEANELWVSDGTADGTRSVASFPGDVRAWLSTGPSGLYFVADDILHGEEIWRSDGTAEGTRRVTEFGYFEPFYLFAFDEGPEGWAFEIGGRLLFAADDRLTGRRLWTSTGTPESTRAVSEPGLGSRLYKVGDKVFAFRHDAAGEDCEIWSFDRQGTGTRIMDSLHQEICGPGSYWDNIRLQVAGTRVYFAVQDADQSSWSIWRSDGTVRGTVRLLSSPSAIGQVEVTAGERRLYFTDQNGLWVREAGNEPRLIAGNGLRNASARPLDLVSHQGSLFFTAGDGSDSPQRAIWSSEGSAPDTILFPSEGCGTPAQLTSLGSSLFYLCDPFTGGNQLRKADPPGGGSVTLAQEVRDGTLLLAHQRKVWFVEGEESEVWTSDGTPGGTVRVRDMGGSPLQTFLSGSFRPKPFALSDGNLVYFIASRPGENTHLWRSDGTQSGTFSLMPPHNYYIFEAARAGAKTLLNVGGRLWRTNGSTFGTVLLTLPTGEDLIPSPYNLSAHGGAFYVYGWASTGRSSFWRTDGTAAGTVALVPPFEWPSPLYDDDFPLPRPVALGAKLFFVAADPEHGAELWVTDGTPAGTHRVADISPGPASSAPSALVAAGGAVWFAAHDPVHGRELWRTDGTAAGTRLVQDIAPEGLSSSPDLLTAVGDRLFFSADDNVSGRELWVVPVSGPGGCQPSDTALCLQNGRFRVEARWRDFDGRGGAGRAVPLTGDTGTFWFFDPANVEVLLKVLDGRGVNDHFWVFYGALSNVEYSLTVTDTQTGLTRRYSNPAGQLASVGDTEGFGPRGALSAEPAPVVAPPSPPALVRGWTSKAAATGGPCVPDSQRLCLNGGRFAVEVAWKDFAGKTGQGTAVPFTGDTGYFWFFDAANVELAVKVLNGTAVNGKFWVFYGALSNVEFTLKVTDTQTGAVREYRNPSGRFASVGDTGAF